jgi:hypothetical protein
MIIRIYTRSSYFIIVIYNIQWKEITDLLEYDQTAQDRPDIIIRIFKIKLDLLLKDLLDPEKDIFDKVITHIYIIEFQKRGLPHAHILLIMDQNDKSYTPEFVDTVVSAELPDPILFPDLYNIIVTSILHGSYDARNIQSPYMKDDKYSKKYPKPFSEHTILPVDIYP